MRRPQLPRLPGSSSDGHVACHFKLTFSDFRCELNSADGDRRRLETFEAQHRSDPLLYATVVLLDSVIQILTRTDPHSLRHPSFHLQIDDGAVGGCISIQCDDPRRSMALHGVAEECFRGSHIAPFAKPKIECSTCSIDSTIQVRPAAVYLYIGLVGAPRPSNRSRVTVSRAALQGRKPNLGSCSSSRAECYLISKLAKLANELVGSFLDCAWIRALTELPINKPLVQNLPGQLNLQSRLTTAQSALRCPRRGFKRR
jgi:hypothetical protein